MQDFTIPPDPGRFDPYLKRVTRAFRNGLGSIIGIFKNSDAGDAMHYNEAISQLENNQKWEQKHLEDKSRRLNWTILTEYYDKMVKNN